MTPYHRIKFVSLLACAILEGNLKIFRNFIANSWQHIQDSEICSSSISTVKGFHELQSEEHVVVVGSLI